MELLRASTGIYKCGDEVSRPLETSHVNQCGLKALWDSYQCMYIRHLKGIQALRFALHLRTLFVLFRPKDVNSARNSLR